MTEPTEAPTSAHDLEVLAEHPTRSSRRNAVVAGYREQMLGQITDRGAWLTIGALYLVAIIAAGILLAHHTIPLILVVVAINALAWWRYSVLRKRDQHFATLALLTPVVDRTTLVHQVDLLKASFQNLLSSISHPVGVEARAGAIALVTNSALAIMERGGVTVETATVAGYPRYPEIDRTPMPGTETDFLTVPLSRIEATITRLERSITTDVVLSESIAQIAGEIIPPLRSVEVTLIG